MIRVLRHGSLLVLATLCLVGLGCGGAKGRATVKGQVTIGGKPLNSGSVGFHGSGDRAGSATIDRNGNFTMSDAPIGDVKISVSVPKNSGRGVMGPKPSTKNPTGEMKDPNKPAEGAAEAPIDPAKIVQIPEHYGDPEKSGLTFKVEKGESTHNIELKP
jgi:hypothetical protein